MNRTASSFAALTVFLLLASGSMLGDEDMIMEEIKVEAIEFEDSVAPDVECDMACWEECTADLLGGPTYNEDMEACDQECGCQ